jgi:hypothetical protein
MTVRLGGCHDACEPMPMVRRVVLASFDNRVVGGHRRIVIGRGLGGTWICQSARLPAAHLSGRPQQHPLIGGFPRIAGPSRTRCRGRPHPFPSVDAHSQGRIFPEPHLDIRLGLGRPSFWSFDTGGEKARTAAGSGLPVRLLRSVSRLLRDAQPVARSSVAGHVPGRKTCDRRAGYRTHVAVQHRQGRSLAGGN